MEENHLDKKEKSHLISSGIKKPQSSKPTFINFNIAFKTRRVDNLALFWTLDSSDEGYSGSNKTAKGNSGFQKISGKAWGVLVSPRVEIVLCCG